jgi:cobalamin biosynthesis protein CobC
MMLDHGGALDRAMQTYGGKAEDWLDLSTGINPVAYKMPPLPPSLWARLPDQKLTDETLSAARLYYGVPEGAGGVIAPGSQALIQLYPSLAPAGYAEVLTPTYEEHAANLTRLGWQVEAVQDFSDLDERTSVTVAVNPNNPDGRRIPHSEIARVAKLLAGRGGFLVVDEAFSDTEEGVSCAHLSGMDGLIILKSFGKFFGLAGIRLGFAFGAKRLTDKLAAMLGPWAVAGTALEIARKAYGDADGIAELKLRIWESRRTLSETLAENGLTEAGGTALFALIEHPEADRIYEGLAAQHILTRRFAHSPHWLRIGLAAHEVEYWRLGKALAALLRS